MDRSRVGLLLVAVLLPFLGLEARLVQMQLVDPQTFVGNLAARETIEVVSPRRGAILDRQGRVLAEDRRAFDCYLVLEDYEKSPREPLLELLGRSTPDHPGLPAAEFQEKVEEIYGRLERLIQRRPREEWRRLYARERRTPYLLRRDISPEAAVAIETCPERFAGALVRESLKRRYPQGEAACHVVGYLGRVRNDAGRNEVEALFTDGYFTEGFDEVISEEEVARLYRRGEFHDALLGRGGVEKSYDNELRGRAGLAVQRREPGTGRKTLIELKPAQPGAEIELTLDVEVQREIENAIAGAKATAVVVLEPATGAVIALASNRSFDPNHFVSPGNPAAAAAIRRVLSDTEGKPLISLAWQQQFGLGSIFKVATSVAGLEEGKVRAQDPLPCRGRFIENSRFFACWIWNSHQGMHGELTVHGALERSCNCYFYELGRRLGVPGIAKWAAAMGYGAATGIDLPGEVRGILPREARQQNDELSLSIGQNELMVSPLQAAVMMCVLANGGSRVTPHVLRSRAPAPVPLGISATAIREIRGGLQDVVFGAQGTAHHSTLRTWKAAGKTSSAQTRQGLDSHAWFAGYAPFDAPKHVVCVFVAYGGGGGTAAAPVAGTVFEILSRAEGRKP